MPGAIRPGRTTIFMAMVCALSLPLGLPGQSPDQFVLTVNATHGGVEVDLGRLLEDAGLQRSLQAGLPIRIRIVTELWRDRFLDAQVGRHEWRATVRFDPLGGLYRVETENGVELHAGSPREATEILTEELEVPLRPVAAGNYYYLARVEVETLSLSDLEELRRWLQGDLAPALGGEAQVGSAVGRGLRRVFVRVLGLPIQRFQTRTPRFNWE